MDDFMEDVDVSSACELTGCGGIEEVDSFSYDATPAEVVQQIEELTSLIYRQLGTFGTAPDLVIMRARCSSVPAPHCLTKYMLCLPFSWCSALYATKRLCCAICISLFLPKDTPGVRHKT